MKISVVTETFHPFRGGSAKRYREVFKRVAARGHDVTIYTARLWADCPTEEDIDGIHVVRTPKVLRGFITKEGFRDVNKVLEFSAWALKRLVKDESPDVIEANHCPIFPALASWLARSARGRPLCVTFHECWHNHWYWYVPSRFYAPLGMVLEKLTAWAPDCVVSVSELTADRLATHLGMKRDRIRVIPNGVDLERIGEVEAERNGKEIVYVGRLNFHKKLDWLIQAYERVRNEAKGARLTIVGEGPAREMCEGLVRRAGVDGIEFTGAVDDAELYRLLRQARVYVLPSIREGQSITTLEAMAAGTPQVVVEADGNGAAELVRAGMTGIVARPSPDAIAEGITRIIDDDELWHEFHSHSLSFVRRYTWNAASAQYLQVYSDLLSS